MFSFLTLSPNTKYLPNSCKKTTVRSFCFVVSDTPNKKNQQNINKTMDSALAKEIEETVLEVLKNSDMDSTTEYQVRKLASEQIGIDLSEPSRKKLVRNIVQTYLEEQQAKAEAQEEKVTEEGEPEQEEEEGSEDDNNNKKNKGAKEFDDEGDLIICRLSDKRRVTLTEFRGKSLVSIREYYKRDGKELPSSKGISLTAEQWSNFSKNVPAIEKAIKKLEGR